MSEPDLERYRGRLPRRRRVVFWLVYLYETLTRRRLSRLVACRNGRATRRVSGLANLPRQGSLVLACNHFKGWSTLDVLAVVMAAAGEARPDLAGRYMVIAGRRERPGRGAAGPVRRVRRWVWRRWSNHLLHLPWHNQRSSARALREWRERVRQQPVIVFPEGQSRVEFGGIRPGAGRWLSILPAPVVPVGVWWQEGQWQVHFGEAIRWSPRSALHDTQIGLNIAALLPPALAPGWQSHLDRWGL